MGEEGMNWIDVNKELPTKEGEYLVWIEGPSLEGGWFASYGTRWFEYEEERIRLPKNETLIRKSDTLAFKVWGEEYVTHWADPKGPAGET